MADTTPVKEGSDRRPRMDGPIICPGHSRPVPNCTFSQVTPYGYFLISACLDGKAMLREGPTGDWIGTFLGHKGAVWCANLNQDATKACTGAGDFTAKLWNAESGECLHTLNHKHIVKTAVFSKDSRQLFTGGAEKKLRIFDLEKPDSVARVLEGHQQSISAIALTPDPHLIVSCAAEANLKVWDLRTGEAVRTLASTAPMSSLSASNDGSALSATFGKTVAIWNSSTFELISSVELPEQVDCVAYDAPSKRFVTGSDNELWVRGYTLDGTELACNKGHHGPVRSVAFNPDGSNYVSGSEDGTLRIWEWA